MKGEVSFSTKYSLMASFNHSGTLDQGHYWAIVKDISSGDWLSCNDKVVVTVPQHFQNNTISYILFYKTNSILIRFDCLFTINKISKTHSDIKKYQ